MDILSVLLLKVSSKLSEKEMTDLKFLCRDRISKKKMETVHSGTDLFSKLLEQTDISEDDLRFLVVLLQQIDRRDLAEEVSRFRTPHRREEEAAVPEERDQLDLAFDIICDNVGREWKTLIRTLGVTEATMEKIIYANPYNMQEQLMQCLKEWRKTKRDSASVSALMQALERCKMRLVADKLTGGLNLSHGAS